MSSKRLFVIFATAIVIAAAAGILTSSSIAARSNKCPSGGTPSPGSTVNGLEVDGQCFVDSIRVNGGVTVDPGAWLFASKITVNGGIDVGSGAELDLDLDSLFGPRPILAGSGSTVNGNITLDHPGDIDIEGARVTGTVTATASGRHPTFCGNDFGGFSLSGYSSAPGTGDLVVGDPGENGLDCTGNTIRGQLSVSNSSSVEVEGNSIGPVTLSASAMELNRNTINSLKCSNGATIVVPDSPEDTPGNTVKGSNSC